MKARLTRVRGGEALRSDSVEGHCYRPEEGRRFQIFAKALHPETGATGRLVETSPIQVVIDWGDESWTFLTESGSVYQVEAL